MNTTLIRHPRRASAPENCPKASRQSVQYEGRKVPLVRDNNGVWRLRSRSKHFRIDVCLGTSVLATARVLAKEMLEAGRGTSTKSASRGTIQQLVDIYFASPRRSSLVVAKGNVSRLRTIVRMVHGKDMKDVPIAALSAKLWSEYQRLRLEQAGLPLDYSRRISEAHSINSAIRQAMSLVSRPSQVAYAAHGITLPSDASTVMQLPEPILIKPPANDDALVTAWRQLRDVDRPLWLALGLARFAGMRREEIVNCRGKWIVTHEGVVSVELRDRPEDRYQTKTGRPYFAPILDADLAAVLASIKPEQLVVEPEGVARAYWFISAPQQWCRPYVSDVQKPLHRLRGLYAVDLRIRTRDAVAAALAGTKAASAALGHTSTEMTERHYLR